MPKFSHLHLHTAYSLLDGASPVKDYIKKCIENGHDSFAITEHGNLYSAIDFYKQAKKAGIKPIIALEAYLTDDHLVKSTVKTAKDKREAKEVFSEEKDKKGKRAYHLTLLAKNNTGYKNLLKLVSIANKDGFYYKPRIDKDLLRQYGEGLICLSGCLGGEINQAILNDELEQAEITIKEYLDIFGNDFYLEVMNHGEPENEKVLPIIQRFAQKYDIKIVATNDAHYANREDVVVQNALIALRDHTTLSDPDLKKFTSDNFYMKSTEEMVELFPNNPEYLQNSYDIAQQCNVEIETNKVIFPEYIQGVDEKKKLIKELCSKGYKEKIKPFIQFESDKKTYGDRVRYELDVINKNGFTDYFLIIQDIVNWAKGEKIPVGISRGSVGGSLVAYLLNITELDPIKYGLYFERFLNPGRISPPDIDLDFADNRREDVINYTAERFGRDKFAKVITFGNFKPRVAIRDSFKVYGYDLDLQDKVAKLVPDVVEGVADIRLEHSYKEVPELLKYKEKYPDVFLLAEKLEGNPRQVSTHASAYVLTDKEIPEYAPLDYDAKNGELRVGYDMHSCDFINILKIDFLGIETLAIVDNAIKLIKKRYDQDIDVKKIQLDNKETWDLIQKGDTIGIFQFESDGMRGLLRKAKPRSINELADCNAIYRPGAAKFIEEYCAVKNGSQQPNYFHPLMEDVLKDTAGVLIFQESVISMCQVLAGFSASDADYMRKAIGKKKKEDMDILRPKFAKGCKSNGLEESLIDKILDWFSEMSRYNFNKSHDVGYSLNAYYSAYIKANYPLEFQTAMLNKKTKEMNDYLIRFQDAARRNIKIGPPDINLSNAEFAIHDFIDGYDKKKGEKKRSVVFFGLNSIKGVGSGVVDKLVEERRKNGLFKSLKDFLERTYEFIDKRTIEGLTHSGAFGTSVNRKYFLSNLEKILNIFKSAKKKDPSQMDLFSGSSVIQIDDLLLDSPGESEYPRGELLSLEKECTGIYCSGSPLEAFQSEIMKEENSTTLDVASRLNDDYLSLVCIIRNKKIQKDRNGNDMAFFDAEDDYGTVRCVVFSKTYDRHKYKIKENTVVKISGRVNNNNILIDRITKLNDSD